MGPMNAFDEEQMPPQGGPMPPMPPMGPGMGPGMPPGAPPMPMQGQQPQLPPEVMAQLLQMIEGAQGAYEQAVPGPVPPQQEGDEGHVCPMCGSKC